MTMDESDLASFPFDNSYARLPERFYARLDPTPVGDPGLIKLNHPLARALGLDPEALSTPVGVDILAGNRLPKGAEPLAMAYAGHQFGNWVPQLGDGRAILLGEVIGTDGLRYDVQLKGAGQTPFSRMGDGRAVLGPVLREYIVSEAMAALGVPTTRALAAVTTGEKIARESVLPGAVLTRVARSHIRIGTFQYFVSRGDTEALRLLADHVIVRHCPDARQSDNPYRALLDAIVAGQASLIAKWQGIGFIHGVMNTDNMSVAGETIDYGPCAFMDLYNPKKVFSSIDQHGRYAFGNQPRIAQWNLAILAQSLLPLLGENDDAALAEGQAAVDAFPALFQEAHLAVLRQKLGLIEAHDDDMELAQDLLDRMAANKADFTLTFRGLCGVTPGVPETYSPASDQFREPSALDEWIAKWGERLEREGLEDSDRQAAMRAVNPAHIPRNHLVQEAITAATENNDFAPFEKLIAVLAEPFEEKPEHARYRLPPRPEQIIHQTYCGT